MTLLTKIGRTYQLNYNSFIGQKGEWFLQSTSTETGEVVDEFTDGKGNYHPFLRSKLFLLEKAGHIKPPIETPLTKPKEKEATLF